MTTRLNYTFFLMGIKMEGLKQGLLIVLLFFLGTFMTIDIALRRLEHTGRVDIKETVCKIRSQRAFAIQMPDQYVFCHLGIVEHAMRQGELEDLDLAGFDDSDSDSDEI